MKILVLNPPSEQAPMVREGRCMQREGAWTAVWAPISLATIAAVLERGGFKVELLDATIERMSLSELEGVVERFDPSLVVINTATGSIKGDLKAASFFKEVNPKVKVAAFGIHVSALPDDCFKMEPDLDFIVRGEPEETVLELAQTLGRGGDFRRAKGLSYKKESKVVHNPPRPPIKDLDELPFPAWEKVKIEKYRMPLSGEPFLLVATGRGCPFNCLFCADKTYYGQKLRLPSAKRVVDELAYDKEKFGIDSFLFWSESFTLDRHFAISVCEEIVNRGLKVEFVVNSRHPSQPPSPLPLPKLWQIPS